MQPSRWNYRAAVRTATGIPALIALIMLSIIILADSVAAAETGVLLAGRPQQSWWSDAVDGLLAPQTIQTLAGDRQLRKSYLAVVGFSASLSRSLSAEYGVPELEQSARMLEKYRQGLLEGFLEEKEGSSRLSRRLFGFGDKSDDDNDDDSKDSDSNSTTAQGLLDALTKPLTSALSGLGTAISGDLAGPAMFLGIGVGQGAAQGLKLATADAAKEAADVVITDSGMQSTGLNPAIRSLGVGASAALTGAVNISSLLASSGSTVDLQAIVLSVAEGLGNGTASGLRLSQAAENLEPPTGSDLPTLAGTLAFGLSKSVVENIDRSSGNSSLLSLSTNTTDALVRLLPSAASGLGKGLGTGIAVGLRLQSEAAVSVVASSSSSIDVSGVAESFAAGLASSLLANGTAAKLLASSSSGSATGDTSIDIGKVAQGMAIGLVQGAGDAVESMGGITALLDGTATTLADGQPSLTSVAFDDTVSGAATGFGLGLGGQGALVAQQLIAKLGSSSGNSSSDDSSSSSLSPALIRRDQAATLGLNLSAIINADTVSTAAQTAVDALTCQGVGGLLSVLQGLQKSGTIPTDLMADGGGNATSLLAQVVPTGLIRIDSAGNTYSLDGQKLSGGLVGSIAINGNTLVKFAVFLVMHILFAIVVFLAALPAFIGLESARNILIRLRLSRVMPNIPRWNSIFWIYVLTPMSILVVLLGGLAMGNAAHFRTAHGVLGLITAIIGIAACGLHFIVKARRPEDGMIVAVPFKLRDLRTVRALVNQVLLALSIATAMTGFSDVSSLTLCITQLVSLNAAVSLGFGLAGLYTLGSAVSGLDIHLSIRECRRWNRSVSKMSLS